MPTPQNGNNTQPATTSLGVVGTNYIDSLLGDYKWGSGIGASAALTYSFPWSTTSAAYWATNPDYTDLAESSSAYALSSAMQDTAQAALASWSAVANITFTEVSESSSSVGTLRFAWTNVANPGAAAWAYYPDSYWASGGDVWLSSSALGTDSASEWVPGRYDFAALVHELGHALGLKHPFQGSNVLPSAEDSHQYSVMSYTSHPHSLFREVTPANGDYNFDYYDIEPDTPMLYDIAAIQYLYGANTSYKTGDDVYTFDPSTPFVRTLWDAAGTDTISVSNFSRSCEIDLTAGHFSSIAIASDALPAGYSGGTQPTYDGTDNLAIAYGAVIENALGGSGNDILSGNSVANSLDGGTGNDTLTGGAGNDTLSGGVGSDVAVYEAARANFSVARTATGYSIYDKNSILGLDSLTGIEYLQFSDVTLSINDAVTSNTAPTLASALIDQSAIQGSVFSFTIPKGTFTDVDTADVLTYSAALESGSVLPSWLSFSASSGKFSGTPSGNDVGALTVRVTATDSGNASVYDDFVLSVASANKQLAGSVSDDKLAGGVGDDILTGGAGNDTLSGGSGNDTLDGGVGSDKMTGGAGNDTYYVDSAKDSIAEKAREGTDTAISTVSFTLANEIEGLTLDNAGGAISGTGNKSANTITGNDSSNTLNGKEGNDILTGGAGNDMFVFDTKLAASGNLDVLVDFTTGVDRINLSKKIFAVYKVASVDLADDFVAESGAVAHASNDHFLYDTSTGVLSYDVDGNGSKAAVQFASLTGASSLSASDLYIV